MQLQAQYKITPLSAWGKPYTPVAPPVNPNPGFSMTDKPQPVILAMGTEGYFNLMAKLMGGRCASGGGGCADDRAHGQDRHRTGQTVRDEQARSGRAGGTEGHPANSPEEDRSQQKSMGAIVNGWVVTKGLGTYGPDDYLKRAVVAAFGWPANQEDDAVYPYTEVDSTGQKLTGANKYTLTFAKGATPPVNGFWSITMYLIDQRLVVRSQSIEQVHRQPARQSEVQRRRFADTLLPERVAGRGQGSQLAAGSEGRIHPHAADVLAEGQSPSILNGSWKPPAVVKESETVMQRVDAKVEKLEDCRQQAELRKLEAIERARFVEECAR